MTSFDSVVRDYDQARPEYPDGVFDALEPLAGRRVLEGGAGTGIATRALLRRGPSVVVPFDVGVEMLRRARSHTADLAPVVADGASLPFRDGCADLICFAQSWHWLDPTSRCREAARVLRRGGRWAGWWSHARADGEVWFDASWDAIEAACPGTHRSQRDIDWGDGITRSGVFTVSERVVVPWVRQVTVQQWLTDPRSHSFVAALATDVRDRLIGVFARLTADAFPHGEMLVPYETWLWTAATA
ncbi:MAG TPA: class I SAM-dependent methyltransferase [Acidimicrobiia bacterium]|nr:class I SAM-dependent methyltransferase [Acidimicrobiia bacterium]